MSKFLKTYENYLKDKLESLKKLVKVVSFMEKNKLTTFIMAFETNGGILFNDITKKDDGKYYLEYESGYGPIGPSGRRKVLTHVEELSVVPDNVIEDLMKNWEDISSIERLLELGFSDIQSLINIYKANKKPIKFNTWMFGMLVESDLQKEANKFEFQNVLFSTHPEAFEVFADECQDGLERSKEYNFEPLKLHPRTKIKFKKLYDNWILKQNAKKYNL